MHWASAVAELDDERPADIDDASIDVPVPSKNDLGLDRALAQQFTSDCLPNAYGQVAAFFQHRRTYAKFRDLLARNGLLDAWHAQEAKAVERALGAWADEQGIPVEPTAETDEG